MRASDDALSGPNLALGVPVAAITDGGSVLGYANGQQVLLIRQGERFYAIGAACTHAGGPLADGLVVGDTVRCPWHHACFSLRTGAALRPPALAPVARWGVERRGDSVHVVGPKSAPKTAARTRARVAGPRKVVIVGGGAAGGSAAETLRREGFDGRITVLSADGSGPYDRTKLSKGYLAGTASADSIPLHAPEFEDAHGIEVRHDAEHGCAVTYRRGGRRQAVAVVHRDRDGLEAEVAFERIIAARVGNAIDGAANGWAASVIAAPSTPSREGDHGPIRC